MLSDSNTDFLVVGVCSAEGVAGPALVDALAGRAPSHAAQERQLPGLQMHVSYHPPRLCTHRAVHPNCKPTAAATFCSVVQVSPKERVITLDACGMLSPALLTALVSSNRPQPAVSSTAAAAVRAAARKAGTGGSSSVPVEGVALLLTLQLLVFLCAVCNVVSVCCYRALLAPGLRRTLPLVLAPGMEWKHHRKACARSGHCDLQLRHRT